MARAAVIGSPYTTIPDDRNRRMFKPPRLSEHLILIPTADGFVHPCDPGSCSKSDSKILIGTATLELQQLAQNKETGNPLWIQI